MNDQDLVLGLQGIVASLNQLVALLEARRPNAPDNRDALLNTLQRALELEQLRHEETHRQLRIIQQAVEPLRATVDAGKRHDDLDKRVSQLSEDIELRARQLQEDVARQSSHGIGVYWSLKERVDSIEQQLFSRRFSDGQRAKFEQHYPEHRWEDAVARFDRWIANEKTCHAEPAAAFRKFIKVWLGEARPRWLVNAEKDDAENAPLPD